MLKEDIISLWKEVGWNNSKDYHDYILSNKDKHDHIIGDLLNPSKTNIKEFWKATDEVFSTDTVANCDINHGVNFSIERANYNNHLIPLFLGLYGGMEFAIFNSKRKFDYVNIAEIGCGFGSFRDHFISIRNDIDLYTGFDVIPRKPEFIELSDDGNFTEEQVELYENTGTYNIFYSCNVFQHLDQNQISKYLNQVYRMLPFGGYFVFSYIKTPENGYTYHYGQKIEIMDLDLFKQKIKEAGFQIWFFYEQSDFNLNRLCPIGFVLEKI
jgi:hypothetical protein